jgi:hypothetical protein
MYIVMVIVKIEAPQMIAIGVNFKLHSVSVDECLQCSISFKLGLGATFSAGGGLPPPA